MKRRKPRDPLLGVRYVHLMQTAAAHRLITRDAYPKKKLLALTLRRAGLGPDDVVRAETPSTAEARQPIKRRAIGDAVDVAPFLRNEAARATFARTLGKAIGGGR
ncbi:MAG: hypothetical protein GY719_25710 [bacterium]|nr:hypothetical protein [bacterium]